MLFRKLPASLNVEMPCRRKFESDQVYLDMYLSTTFFKSREWLYKLLSGRSWSLVIRWMEWKSKESQIPGDVSGHAPICPTYAGRKSLGDWPVKLECRNSARDWPVKCLPHISKIKIPCGWLIWWRVCNFKGGRHLKRKKKTNSEMGRDWLIHWLHRLACIQSSIPTTNKNPAVFSGNKSLFIHRQLGILTKCQQMVLPQRPLQNETFNGLMYEYPLFQC